MVGVLSNLASMIVKEERSVQEAAEDIDAFGAPSECMDLVNRGHRRSLARIFLTAGIWPDDYNEEIRKRITYKSAYQLNLLVDPEEVLIGMREIAGRDPGNNLFRFLIEDRLKNIRSLQ